jgi:hypothetical protein
MTARANWFVAQLASLDDEPDPFDAPIEEVGQRIDLRDPRERLEMRLRELLERESNLFNANITCAIKDMPNSCCHACPVSKATERGDPMHTLCRLGREQEAVLTELAVLACRDETPAH